MDDAPRIWWFVPEVEALVLGSSQDVAIVDRGACARVGVEVVKRRSGGGAVLVSRSATIWLDVVIPARSPLWDADVVRSTFWLGDVFVDVLSQVGVNDVVRHSGPLETSPESSVICFAGRGPGEVFLADGRKVVGISQRRTRTHARFQCAISLRWDPDKMLSLLCEPRPDISRIHQCAASLDIDPDLFRTTMNVALLEKMHGVS